MSTSYRSQKHILQQKTQPSHMLEGVTLLSAIHLLEKEEECQHMMLIIFHVCDQLLRKMKKMKSEENIKSYKTRKTVSMFCYRKSKPTSTNISLKKIPITLKIFRKLSSPYSKHRTLSKLKNITWIQKVEKQTILKRQKMTFATSTGKIKKKVILLLDFIRTYQQHTKKKTGQTFTFRHITIKEAES